MKFTKKTVLAIASFVLLLLQALGVRIDFPVVNEVICAGAGVLVMLGLISDSPSSSGGTDNSSGNGDKTPTTGTEEETPTTEPTEEEPTTEPTEEDPPTEPTEEDPTTKPTEEDPTTEPTEEDPTTEPTEEDIITGGAAEADGAVVNGDNAAGSAGKVQS